MCDIVLSVAITQQRNIATKKWENEKNKNCKKIVRMKTNEIKNRDILGGRGH